MLDYRKHDSIAAMGDRRTTSNTIESRHNEEDARLKRKRKIRCPPVIVLSDSSTDSFLTQDKPDPKRSAKRVECQIIPPLVPAIPRPPRKNDKKLQPLSEQKQLFKGFIFFYIPNNDVCTQRRRRMALGYQHGAVWTREWHPHVTHIIVDSYVPYQDVLKFLKMDSIPEHIPVLNHTWTPDCMAETRVVEHSHTKYRLEGHECGTNTSVKSARSAVVSRAERVKEQYPEINTPEKEDIESLPPFATSELQERTTLIKSSALEATSVFTATIKEAESIAHLPIDSDEDNTDNTITKGLMISNNENWQKRFACMMDPSKKSDNPNAFTIDMLSQMVKYYETNQDPWRYFAYRRAILSLKKHEHLIATSEEAQKLRFIGPRIADKIEEIVKTGKLRRLENAKLNPTEIALREFMKIYSVGFSTASKWIQQGFKTMKDLLDNVELTENQRIGIAHLEDFNTRIPRNEVTELGQIVEKAVQSIDSGISATIAGSYRRGALDCGDIDIILSKSKTNTGYLRALVLDKLVPCLFEQEFLMASLAKMSREDGTKWHGACRLPSTGGEHHPWRRIDILIVPHDELGAALLYFTGSDLFNRSMRLFARKRSMRLNQRGLYVDVTRGPDQKKLTDGRKVAGEYEIDIFNKLGVPWREPWDRNI